MEKIDKFLSEISADEKKYLFEKLKQKRKRDIQIKFNVDEKEMGIINKKIEKSKMIKSDYLRSSALQKDILVIDDFKKFFIEMKKQGTNLNQIAKEINTGIISEINFREMKEEYKKINDSIVLLLGKL